MPERPVSNYVGSLSPEALRRLIRTLTPDERDRLYQTIVHEYETIPPNDPREQLLWHVEKERSQRFRAWFRTLDAVGMSRAYLQLVAGVDREEIMAGNGAHD